MAEPPTIRPDPADPRLTRAVRGVDHEGVEQEIRVVEERPLTIFLNGQEIVTAMTIGDYPAYLAVGYLRNQGMLRADDRLTGSSSTRSSRRWWCAPSGRRTTRRS
jgi:FdhD protein